MGNAVSTTSPLYLSEEVSWRSGIISQGVPAPQTADMVTFGQLWGNSEFKDFLCKHIDNDHLISSILNGADDPIALVRSLAKFQPADPEIASATQAIVNNLQLCVAAGLDVPVQTLVSTLEKQIELAFKDGDTTFISAFQRRLGGIRLTKYFLDWERAKATTTIAPRVPEEPTYCPAELAQRIALRGLKDAGLGLLRIFPVCMPALRDDSQRGLLVRPILQLCDDLAKTASLQLLSATELHTLEVIRKEPLLDFVKDCISVEASPEASTSCLEPCELSARWVSPGGSLRVSMKAPQGVTSLTFQWVFDAALKQVAASAAPVTANPPQRVSVFAVMVEAENGEERSVQHVWTFEPAKLHAESGSWVHTIDVELARVKQLRIFFSAAPASDASKAGGGWTLNTFRVGLQERTTAEAALRTIPLLRDVQYALTPLIAYAPIAQAVYDAQLAVIRGTGSLGLLLGFLNTILVPQAARDLQQCSPQAVLSLLKAIHASEEGIRDAHNQQYAPATRTVDATFRPLSAEDSPSPVATCRDSLTLRLASEGLSKGSYEWEMTVTEEVSGDESVFLGICDPSLRAESVLTSTEAFTVRCYNGELFHSKRCALPAVCAIHQGDVCRFVYDADRGTLALWVNEEYQGVLFEFVPANLVPCVLFQRSAHQKSVRIGNMTLKTKSPNSAVRPIPTRAVPALETVVTAPSLLELILRELRSLAIAAALNLQQCKTISTLVLPFCAEVTVEVFAMLIALIKAVSALWEATQGEDREQWASILVSLLTLLDLFLLALSASMINPVELGFHAAPAGPADIVLSDDFLEGALTDPQGFIAGRAEGASPRRVGASRRTMRERQASHVMAAASQLLQSFMRGPPSEVAVTATAAFGHGLSLFLSSTAGQVALAGKALTTVVTQNGAQGAAEEEGSSAATELRLFLRHFKDAKQVMRLVASLKDLNEQDLQSSGSTCGFVLQLLEYVGLLQARRVSFSLRQPPSDLEICSVSLLNAFQQHLVFDILDERKQATVTACTDSSTSSLERCLVRYFSALVGVCGNLLSAQSAGGDIGDSQRDTCTRDSVVGVLLHPFLYALALPGFPVDLYKELCAPLLVALRQLSDCCASSTYVAVAERQLRSTLVPKSTGPARVASFGWRPIKATFEDGDGTFTVSENGCLFTSAVTSNTCAVVSVKFNSKQRAAWEFLLEHDSVNDECSTFGAARTGFASRCYSSSPDLYMRRAYNGYLYALGSSTGDTMDKIKPGDLVRVEFDGKAGTLSYSINGGELLQAFTGITDEIYPACGSYRNNVSIRLIKVEVYDALDSSSADDSAAELSFMNPTADIKWVLSEDHYMSTKDPKLLTPFAGKGNKPKSAVSRWVTARGDRGAVEGVHEWSVELTAANRSHYAVGVVLGPSVYPFDKLAGPCLKISSKTPKTSVIPGSLMRLDGTAAAGTSPVPSAPAVSTPTAPPTSYAGIAALPPGVAAPTAIATAVVTRSTASTPTADASPLPPLPPAAELGAAATAAAAEQSPEIPFSRTFRYPPDALTLSWQSDGSLWHNGVRVASDFGSKFLPLSKGAVVTVRVDRTAGTISYYVNGEHVGVAFGPESSGAAYTVKLPEPTANARHANVDVASIAANTIFPAASASSSTQALRLRASGFNGSTVLPLALSMQHAAVSLIGRLSAVMIAGPEITASEVTSMPWFASNLMIGGMEDSRSDLDQASSESNGEAVTASGLLRLLSTAASDQLSPTVEALFKWFEIVDPEPGFLRLALQRNGTYSFPAVEAPFLACLLKHSGLVEEAVEVVRTSSAEHGGDAGESTTSPSADMVKLWQRVKQLRVFLRQQRQALRSQGFASTDAQSPSRAANSSPNRPALLTVSAGSVDETEQQALLDADASESPARNSTQEVSSPEPAEEVSTDGDVNEHCVYVSSDDIEWVEQKPAVVALTSVCDFCILAWGADVANELLYVRLRQRVSDHATELKPQTAFKLGDGTTFALPSDWHIAAVHEPTNTRLLCVRFDLSTIRSAVIELARAGGTFEFLARSMRYALTIPSGLEAELIRVGQSSGGESPGHPADPGSRLFEELCGRIRDKALFLLKFAPAVRTGDAVTDSQSRLLLRSLTKKYSKILPASGNNEDLSRWRAQERWKRVIEFLHLQGSNKSQKASPTVASASLGPPAAVRTASFGMSGASSMHSLARINSSIREEEAREKEDDESSVRAALQACAIFMVTDVTEATPQSLEGALQVRLARAVSRIQGLSLLCEVLMVEQVRKDPLALEPLLSFLKAALEIHLPKGAAPDSTVQGMCKKIHYLNSLEGCSTRTLCDVQAAFVALFHSVSCILEAHMATLIALTQQGVAKTKVVSTPPCQPHLLSGAVSAALELWTMHFSTRDHFWLHRSGIVALLQRYTSSQLRQSLQKRWLVAAEESLQFLRANEAHAVQMTWSMWPKASVQDGLRNGQLTSAQLLHYLCTIPDPTLRCCNEAPVKEEPFAALVQQRRADDIIGMYFSVLKRFMEGKAAREAEQLRKDKEEAAKKEKLALAMTQRLAPCGCFEPTFKGRCIVLSGYNLEASIGDDGRGTAVCVYTNVMYDAATRCEATGNYFEVTVLALGRKDIGVGLADRGRFAYNGYMPGWEPRSYGYHGDDGHKFGEGRTPGDWPLFEQGDVIGCGFDYERRAIFYTRNGELLGDAFVNVSDTHLWPVVGFSNRHRAKEHVKINFGLEPFTYDAAHARGHPLALQERVKLEAERASSGAAVDADDPTAPAQPFVPTRTESRASNEGGTHNPLACADVSEFKSRFRQIVSELKAAEEAVGELNRVVASAQLLHRFLFTTARSPATDGVFNSVDLAPPQMRQDPASTLPNQAADVNASSGAGTSTSGPTILKLTKDVSLFGTPVYLTESHSANLRRGMVDHYTAELQACVLALTGGACSNSGHDDEEEVASVDSTACQPEIHSLPLDEGFATTIAHDSLLMLTSAVSADPGAREAVSHSVSLRALFLALGLPNARIRDLAAQLLNVVLPDVSPAAAQEALPAAWAEVARVAEQGRPRKMPTELITALLLTTSRSCTSTGALVYGTGTQALELADTKVQLLQRLFAAAHWRELVASVLTDAFRAAIAAVDAAGSAGPAASLDASWEQTLSVACVACSVLYGLGVRRTGARVQLPSKEKGILLSLSEEKQVAQYVPDRNLLLFDPSQHISSAAAADVEPVITAVEVDLSDLSLPLLQLFVEMVSKLLTQLARSTAPLPAGRAQLSRLASVSVLSLSQLLVQQPEAIDFVQDTDIMDQLVLLALQPSQLSYAPTLADLLQTWQAVQMRLSELQPLLPVALQAEGDSLTQIRSSPSSTATTAVSRAPSNDLTATAAEAEAKEAAIATLTTELGAPSAVCKLYLDFHAGDVDLARDSLQALEQSGGLEAVCKDVETLQGPSGEVEDKHSVVDDTAILRRIAAVSPEMLTTQAMASTPRQYKSGEYNLLSVAEYLRRLDHRAAKGISEGEDRPVLLIRSALEGQVRDVEGVQFYTTAAELRACPTGENMVTRHIDGGSGFLTLDLGIPANPIRIVSGFFGEVALEDMPAHMGRLDHELVSHCARSIVGHLLMTGNLSVHRDLPERQHWSALVRLTAVQDGRPLSTAAAPLCNALIENGAYSSMDDAEDGVQQVVSHLADEVVANVKALARSSLFSTPSSLSEAGDGDSLHMQFASPHPFKSPCNVSGTFSIPSAWRGASLQFHPKCSTPSTSAKLLVSAVAGDGKEANQLLALCGPPANWKDSLSYTLPSSVRQFSYFFSAPAGSHVRAVALQALAGSPQITNRVTVSAAQASDGKVGLGEDDSLFNLFEPSGPACGAEPCAVTCDVPFLTTGAWFYECTVTKSSEVEGDLAQCAIGFVSAAFNGSADDPFSSVNSCVIGGLGAEVVMQGAAMPLSVPMGPLKELDRVGCLLQITDSTVSMWVAKNGRWSDGAQGSIAVERGWRPFVRVAGPVAFAVNVGELPFYHSPPSQVIRQLQGGTYQMVQLGAQADTPPEAAWGYHFAVRPQRELRLQLCTTFELVRKIAFDSGDSLGTSPSTPKKLWVWRPVGRSAHFLPWGDIVTTSEYPPDRTFLLDKHQCKLATATSLVFSNSKLDFSVRRLQAPPGYVALGDAVCSHSSSGSGMEFKFCCVPEWAARECEASTLLSTFKKCGSTGKETCGSLWLVDGGLGGFLGSPFEQRHLTAAEADLKLGKLDHYGVGKAYTLVNASHVAATLSAEWRSERDVLSLPSLQWTLALLNQLLDSEVARSSVLTAPMFMNLANFVRSGSAPMPLAAVPTLIRMIRLSLTHGEPLPLEELKPFCKTILGHALLSKHAKIPLALMKLVDFVVEVQAAHIDASHKREEKYERLRQYILCRNSQEYRTARAAESAEEVLELGGSSAAVESKVGDGESTPPPLLRRQSSDFEVAEDEFSAAELDHQLQALTQPGQEAPYGGACWWVKESVPSMLLKLHRGIKHATIKDLFTKESTIMRLRQVLKFVSALDSSDRSTAGHTRNYPRFMTSKLWSEHACSSVTEESSHPYRVQKYTRRVRIPNAEALHIVFDRRCALAKGDKLTVVTNSNHPVDMCADKTIFELTAATTEAELAKGVKVDTTCDYVVFQFQSETLEGESAATAEINAEGLWGWGCVIYGAGKVYWSADTVVDLTGTDPVSADNASTSDRPTEDQRNELVRQLVAGQKAEVGDARARLQGQLADLHAIEDVTTTITPAYTALCQLVCLDGVVVREGSLCTPHAHALTVTVDQACVDEASSKLFVVQLSTTSTSTVHPASADRSLRDTTYVFVGKGMAQANLNELKGDHLSYRVFAIEEGVFTARVLETVSALGLATVDPTVQPEAAPVVIDTKVPESGTKPRRTLDEIAQAVDRLSEALTELDAAGRSTEGEEVEDRPASPPAVVADVMWECAVCTLLNPPHIYECVVCTAPRPSAGGQSGATPAAAAGGLGIAPDATSAGWWCRACTFINALSQSTCAMCGTARDEGTAGQAAVPEPDEASSHSSASRSERSNSSSGSGSESEDDEDQEGDEEDYDDEDEDSQEDEDDYEEEDEEEDSDPDESSQDEEGEEDEQQPPTVSGHRRRHHVRDTLRAIAAGRKSDTRKEKDQQSVGGRQQPSLSVETKRAVLGNVGNHQLLIVVGGHFTPAERFEACLLGAVASQGEVLTPAQMGVRLTDWTAAADSELIDYINQSTALSQPLYQLTLPKKLLTYCSPSLASKSVLDVQFRVQHIQEFNKHLEHLIPFIDLGNTDPRSLGSMIRKCNRYLLLKVKTPLLESAISNSTVTSGKGIPASLVLDNTKALASREREEREPATAQNCFVQAFQQLNSKEAGVYRCAAGSDRAFQTSFTGESGIDAGGVFREGMSRIVEDLFSEHFNLLLLCPNGQQSVHSNTDKYVPNPQHCDSTHGLQMFEFIGKLMAMSIRTKLSLPFEFAPLIWKKLVGEVVDLEDLTGVDAIVTKQVESIRAWDLDKVDTTRLRFEYIGTDKVERELIPGGRDMAVTFENRERYCVALVAARLSEFDAAVAAMARGMEEVIPGRALMLFSGTQLEELVCGSPTFDLELWRRNTDSTGVSAATVSLFWKVMATFTHKELAGFVRFAWGRSRLPPAKEFTTKMRLTSGGSAVLPVSHTCFFSVELPEYRTEEKMRHGLLTAIHFGVGGILNG